MKIGHIDRRALIDQGGAPSKTKPTPSGFEQVFNETLQKNVTAKSEPPPVFQPSAALPCRLAVSEPFDAASGVQAMEDFIEALEGYQQRLADPACRLRDIAPSLERLELAHRHLAHHAAEAPVESTLGSIMNEGLVTATTEIQRFRSGAYC